MSEEMRMKWIDKLEGVIEDARKDDVKAINSILCGVVAALYTGNEKDLCFHQLVFAEVMLGKIREEKRGYTMIVPQLPKSKDLTFCQHALMIFLERLCIFDNEVQKHPNWKTTGVEGDIAKLQELTPKMIEKLEKMKGMIDGC